MTGPGRAAVFVYLDLGLELGLEARIVGIFFGLTPVQVIRVLDRIGDDLGLRLAQLTCRRALETLLERRGGSPSPHP